MMLKSQGSRHFTYMYECNTKCYEYKFVGALESKGEKKLVAGVWLWSTYQTLLLFLKSLVLTYRIYSKRNFPAAQLQAA